MLYQSDLIYLCYRWVYLFLASCKYSEIFLPTLQNSFKLPTSCNFKWSLWYLWLLSFLSFFPLGMCTGVRSLAKEKNERLPSHLFPARKNLPVGTLIRLDKQPRFSKLQQLCKIIKHQVTPFENCRIKGEISYL